METDYRLEIGSKPPQLKLDNLHFGLLDLSLKLSKAEKAFIELKKMDLDQVNFNLTEKRLQVGEIRAGGGSIDLRMDEAGRMNIEQIVRQDPEKKTAEARPAESAVKVEPSVRPPFTPMDGKCGQHRNQGHCIRL